MRFLNSGNISLQSAHCSVKFPFPMYFCPAKFEIDTIHRCKVRVKNIAPYHSLFDCYSCKAAINFGKSLISSRFVYISTTAMVYVSTVAICTGETQNTRPYTVKLTIFVYMLFPRNQSESGLRPSPSNDPSLVLVIA